MKFENVDVLKNIASFRFLYVLNCIFYVFTFFVFGFFKDVFRLFFDLKIS